MLVMAIFCAYVERMTRNELADRLRRERAGKRLSLREVAKLTGIGLGSLSEIERGKRNLSYDTARELLRFYGFDIQVINTSDMS